MTANKKSNLFLPAVIVLIGVIVSAGVFIYRHQNNIEKVNENIPAEISLKSITNEDKILGNPNAEIFIVEYSDFECPYCQKFHETMNSIMYEFGREGKVAWIYRHFPLESVHRNAKAAAIASECVYKIGGNEKFWQYADTLFDPSTDILTASNLEKIAMDLGINYGDYIACINSEETLNKINSDIADGKLLFENDPQFGTPYSFVITRSGIQTKIVGAQPLAAVRNLIDQLLK